MLSPQLKTFVCVAEQGSFAKAAAVLFVSPTAVMKQINALEDRLGFPLFARTAHGVQLTAGGERIYRDAAFLFDYAARSVDAARALMAQEEQTFCVGTSLLNPAKVFMDLWYRVNRSFPDYKLHLVSFDDDHNDIVSVIAKLGVNFDFLVGVCDSRSWLANCNMLPLGHYRKMCAVSREHPLAKKQRLSISDLYGQTLMMVAEGDSDVNDFIRNDLRRNHPQIAIEDTPHFYDLSVFNRCAETDRVLLTLECWQDVHPGLVTIPVDWDYQIPYGLLYPLNPLPDIKRFVEVVAAL